MTGHGLGGAMSNAVTLTSEYCPARLRSFLVTTMFCGFTCGSALGGFAAAALIVNYGWRSVLLVGGGIVPLVMALVYVPALPESVRYMVAAGKARWRASEPSTPPKYLHTMRCSVRAYRPSARPGRPCQCSKNERLKAATAVHQAFCPMALSGRPVPHWCRGEFLHR